ncbi:multicopper oxidase domain-containing protein [Haloarcula sp. JP-L23]|nr:multicopper oxidase domain-containing protein [Haloarcula sp. JP-L23]
MRIHDEVQPDLVPLPNSSGLIGPDDDTPGYPEFVADAIREAYDLDPDESPIGNLPPKPPLSSVNNPRQPTDVEEQVFGPAEDIVPGAPYADPCTRPEPDRIVEYTIAVMRPGNQERIVYNDSGDYDPEALVYVLDQVRLKDPDGTVRNTIDIGDAELLRNGELNPEPLFVRANVGDCVEIRLQNELEEGFPSSVHPHFVGFDQLGSESVTTGFNYEQSTDPGDTMQYRWYADEEGAIFFHDHIIGVSEGMHGLFCGLIVEPKGSEWLDPYSGDPLYSGAQAIIDPPESEAFREQALHYHDFAQLVDPDTGEFVNPDREHNQNAGTMAINYRNSPFYHRDDEDPAYVHSSKAHGDPETPVLEAYAGDPLRLRLFQGSYEEQHNFGLHGLQFDPEGFAQQDSVSQVIGTSEAFTFKVSSSETGPGFDHITNPDGLPVRDYRYGSNTIDDMWTGMWGLTRVWDAEVGHLQTLPGRAAPTESVSEADLEDMGHPAPFADFDWTEEGQRAKLRYADDDDRALPPDRDARQNGNVGEIPPAPDDPGDPCPDDAPVRSFNVTAFQVEIPYNDYGDRDEYGVVFALDRHVEEIRNGERPVEPLTLHANEGDCIEINLTNDLPEEPNDDHPHPKMRVSQPWDRSSRISLHPLLVDYDVNGSNGSTVGFNYDTTVDRDETITYRWFAGGEVGTSLLWDMADVRSTRHHGAFGQLVVEPRDSVTLDARTAEASVTSAESMIQTADGTPDFRENALIFADGQFVLNRDDPDDCVVPPGPDIENPDDPCNQLGDTEDQGYGGVNYRAEPFVRRFERNDAQHLVYSSRVHGDPNTPVLKALTDDPVRFRVGSGADKARAVAFHLADHQWERFQGVDQSPVIGVDGQLSPGKAETFSLLGGAGGLGSGSGNGDYIYQETKQRRRLEAGLWGLFRVRQQPDRFPDEAIQPLPDRAGNVPLPGRPGYVVQVGDVTGTGQQDVVVGVPESEIGAMNAGAVYVFTETNPSEVTSLADATLQLLGTTTGERVGSSIRLRPRQGESASDIVAETDSGAEFVVPGGQPFRDLVDSPPRSDVAEFVRQTTNTRVRSIAAFADAATQMDGDTNGNGNGNATSAGDETATDAQSGNETDS